MPGLQVTVKVENDRYYPVDENAKNFARIAGTKTLTPSAVESIRRLGCEIKIELPELTE